MEVETKKTDESSKKEIEGKNDENLEIVEVSKKNDTEGKIRCLALGFVDWTLKWEITKEDIAEYSLEKDKLFSLRDITTQIFNLPKIRKKIKVTSNNELLNTLLCLSKSTKADVFIDFIPLKAIRFKQEEDIFAEIFKTALEEKGWYISEYEIAEKAKASWLFICKVMDRQMEFHFGTDRKLKNITKRDSVLGQIHAKGTSKEDYPVAFVRKSENFNEFPFDNIKFRCQKYELFYLHFETLLNFPSPTFNLKDVWELMMFLEDANTTKIINFVDDSYIFDIEQIHDVFKYTDVFVFPDKSSLVSLFNPHIQQFSKTEPKKNADCDYFINQIATIGNKKKQKYLLYMEDFVNFNIIEVNGSYNSKTIHDVKPYPQVNHSNFKLIEKYKTVIKENYSMWMGLFMGGLLGKICEFKGEINQQTKLYEGYLVGKALVQRTVELLKNDIPLIENKAFYVVAKTQKKVKMFKENRYYNNKEEHFILDCTNRNKSEKKEYVGLFDNHLNGFFNSKVIRKDLRVNGWINKNGEVLYDPVYRKRMGRKKKLLNPINKLLEKQKMVGMIKSINVTSDWQEKEFLCKEKLLALNIPVGFKLPLLSVPGSQKKGQSVDDRKTLSSTVRKKNTILYLQ